MELGNKIQCTLAERHFLQDREENGFHFWLSKLKQNKIDITIQTLNFSKLIK